MELVSTISNSKTTEGSIRPQTKITGVNIDCLEEIFKYLDLKDLLNVADSNKRLRAAASFIFAFTYQPKIRINHSLTRGYWKLTYFRSWNNAADSELMQKLEEGQQLDTLKICFQLFRCFGSRIEFLLITTANEDEYLDTNKTFSKSYITAYERLLSYANEYCHGSLKEVGVVNCPQGAFDELKKPFLKVEKFEIYACIMKTSLWNVLFPQLRHLDYRDLTKIIDSSPIYGIENQFPHLEKLVIFIERTNICTALRLNPQLQALEFIWFPPDLNTLQTIARSLPALEELKLEIRDGIGRILQHNRIHFKNVKTFFLYNRPYLSENRLSVIDSYKFPPQFDFPFTFDQLETFLCHVDSFESAETIRKFFKENPSIVKLRLWDNDINLLSASELAEILPLLEYIEIIDHVKDLNNVIELANKIKTLRIISVRIKKLDDVKYLSSRMRLKDISVVEHIDYDMYRIQLLIA